MISDARPNEEVPVTESEKRERRVSLNPEGDDDDINAMPDASGIEAAQPLKGSTAPTSKPAVSLLSTG